MHAHLPRRRGRCVDAQPFAPAVDAREPRAIGARTGQQPACPGCGLQDACRGGGDSTCERAGLLPGLVVRRRLSRGSALFRSAGRFRNLFAVARGVLKSVVVSPDGRLQVSGFHVAGDVLGLEAIEQGAYLCDAVALQDAEVCVLPYRSLLRECDENPSLARALNRVMSREIRRAYDVMSVLGQIRADDRVAGFLLDMSKRLSSGAALAGQFTLPMSREDIASYLGLTLETVSRSFSRLHDSGLIAVRGKRVRLDDTPRMAARLSGGDAGGETAPAWPLAAQSTY